MLDVAHSACRVSSAWDVAASCVLSPYYAWLSVASYHSLSVGPQGVRQHRSSVTAACIPTAAASVSTSAASESTSGVVGTRARLGESRITVDNFGFDVLRVGLDHVQESSSVNNLSVFESDLGALLDAIGIHSPPFSTATQVLNSVFILSSEEFWIFLFSNFSSVLLWDDVDSVGDNFNGNLLDLHSGLVLREVLFDHFNSIVVFNCPFNRDGVVALFFPIVDDFSRPGYPLDSLTHLILDNGVLDGNILNPTFSGREVDPGLVLHDASTVAGETGLAGGWAGRTVAPIRSVVDTHYIYWLMNQILDLVNEKFSLKAPTDTPCSLPSTYIASLLLYIYSRPISFPWYFTLFTRLSQFTRFTKALILESGTPEKCRMLEMELQLDLGSSLSLYLKMRSRFGPFRVESVWQLLQKTLAKFLTRETISLAWSASWRCWNSTRALAFSGIRTILRTFPKQQKISKRMSSYKNSLSRERTQSTLDCWFSSMNFWGMQVSGFRLLLYFYCYSLSYSSCSLYYHRQLHYCSYTSSLKSSSISPSVVLMNSLLKLQQFSQQFSSVRRRGRTECWFQEVAARARMGDFWSKREQSTPLEFCY